MTNSSSKLNNESTDKEIDINAVFQQYAYYWKYFILSLILAVSFGLAYLYYATPLYKVDAKVLLENEGKASGEMAGLAELSALTGGSGQSAFVLDQIDVFRSRRLLQKVIEANNLQYSYFLNDGFRRTELIGANSPIKVLNFVFADKFQNGEIKLEIINDKSFKVQDDKNVSTEFGRPIVTSFGSLTLVPNKDLSNYIGQSVTIQVQSVYKTIDDLQRSVKISPNTEKQSYIINFSLDGPLLEKSELILNSLINQYNEDVLTDQNKVTQATSRFIDSRLTLIGKDLDVADKKVQDYKSVNNLTDLLAESELNLKTLSETDKDVLEKKTQVQLVNYMIEAMAKSGDLQLLPTNVGLSDLSIEKNLGEYNNMVLERDDLLKSSTKDNPVVKNITENILALNKNIKTSLNNYRSVLELSLRNVELKKNQLQGKVSAIPSQELGFKEISRQQKTVEAMYLFLLQKREENEIKASARPQVMKVIDTAYGSSIPIAPKRGIILLASMIIGLLIPFVVLYLKFLFDNKVHSRKDVEEILSAPILGEVPRSEDPVLKNNDRSALAEAFRIIRTNISFILGNKKESSVVFVTSTTSGEGKSFISTNLAGILAMSGKRVLLLGADIRSPKVLDYLGLAELEHINVGITQFLINPDMEIDNIIIKKPADYQFDIIYSGYIAPNPAELLMNGHFEKIINYGRDNYDYVIVDTAPVGLVTDTLLIADSADMTIYVTRANYLEKRMLNIPKELYEQGKLKNMSVVLNDVDLAKGYGYGYGYGYGEQKELTFKEKLFAFFKLK